MLQSKKFIRILADILSINLTLFLTYFCFFRGWSFMFQSEAKAAMVLMNLIWLSLLFSNNSRYGGIEYATFKKEVKKIVHNVTLHFLIFYVIDLFINNNKNETYYLWISSFYTLFLIILVTGRLLLKTALNGYSKTETIKYVVVGYSKAIHAIENALNEEHFGKMQYLGYFSKNEVTERNYLGKIDSIYDYLKTTQSNLILCAPNEISPIVVQDLMQYAKFHFIDFKLIPHEIELFNNDFNTELHNGFPLLSAKNDEITRIRYKLLKRVFDIVFSLSVILFILSWLYPIVALLIMLESKGPALFKQKRIGYQGKVFICYKFRSMVVHTEKDGITQAILGDHRLTKIGSFIRKTNIDELPQFFNVLLGNMSVVGPRPHAIPHDTEYKNTIAEYILRHYTKPGITGWAQVNGWRGPTDTKEKIIGRAKHDIWYIRNWSFFLDIKIILMTLFSREAHMNAF